MEISIQSKHYMVVPAGKIWNAPSNLNFMVSFSGLAIITPAFLGYDASWHTDTIHIYADDMGMNTNILPRAKSLLPPIDETKVQYEFVPLQWTVYASFNSIFNQSTAKNAGWEVDKWKITRDDRNTEPNNTTVKVLRGMDIEISVRDDDGELRKVGYEMNLYGYFATVKVIIPD